MLFGSLVKKKKSFDTKCWREESSREEDAFLIGRLMEFLEGKRGEMYNCKSQSLLPLEIPLVSSGSVGNRVREKEINLRRAAPRNGYYPGFTAPAETPIRYGRVTTRLSRGSYGFT